MKRIAPEVEGAGTVLELRSAPHRRVGRSTEALMWQVSLAALPAVGWAIWSFGLVALAVVATAVIAAVLTEATLARAGGRTGTIRDGSVVVTGVLFALTLPPSLPLWMVALGAALGVGVAKSAFGGLGSNLFNPALVGRALLQALFPAAMTTWSVPFGVDRFSTVPSSTLAFPLLQPTWDGVSGATALGAWKLDRVTAASTDLLLGQTGGSLGETSALLIVLGGLFLVVRRVMSWQIPVAILGSVALLAELLHRIEPTRFPSALFMLGAGGLMLGAVFMATDPVASPMTTRGRFTYGVLIGVLVVVIRVAGGLPEGVMYAILFANAVSPLLDRVWQPRVFGTGGVQA